MFQNNYYQEERVSVMREVCFYNSPVGYLRLTAEGPQLIGLDFSDEIHKNQEVTGEIMRNTIQQLDEYFAGKRRIFEIPIRLIGTEFQKKVWNQLIRIGFGEMVSYKDIAEQIGNPKAVRAVGFANGRNPISIIVPCHRVIGSNGKMVGYGGGVWRKEWLLSHEKKELQRK